MVAHQPAMDLSRFEHVVQAIHTLLAGELLPQPPEPDDVEQWDHYGRLLRDLYNIVAIYIGLQGEAGRAEARREARQLWEREKAQYSLLTAAVEGPPLKTYTAAELMTLELPEPRYAIPDVLVEGVTLLAGRPKIGKSWLVLNWALASASGGHALGQVVEPGAVLYAALEDNQRRLQTRLKALLAPQEAAPKALHIVHQLPRLHEGLVETLTTWPKPEWH